MTRALSWKRILEYVSSYNPLDSGADSACGGSASSGLGSPGSALSGLLSGLSTAEYGYLGYLVLFIQKQGKYGLRNSVIFANLQKGSEALLRFLFVYVAKFRLGLVRMILFTYGTFMAGSLLLWVSPSKCSNNRLLLFVQLLTLTVGYAGEGSIIHVFIIWITGKEIKEETTARIKIRVGVTMETNARPGCTCYHPADPLVGCIAPAATARESCACFSLGEQCNWRPHVCPIIEEGAQEGLRPCCYPELSCTEEDNRGNSSDIEEQKPAKNCPQGQEMECVPGQPQQKNEREMRNRVRNKLFAAKLPGAIVGTVLAAVFSSEDFFKISTLVTAISYNLFFWMGAKCYKLGQMENDITAEKKSAKMEKQEIEKDEENSTDGNDENQIPDDEENSTDGNDEIQIPDDLLPELLKAGTLVIEEKLLLLWLTFVSTCYLVNATADTFFMAQVDYLANNTQSQSPKIPISVFYFLPDIVSKITEQVCFCIMEQYHDENVGENCAAEAKNKEARWARLLRISIGMLFSSLCCIVAALVAHRLDCNYNSASMLWLLPQFLLWGMMKGILEEGLKEFLQHHLNDDLKGKTVSGQAKTAGNVLSSILTAASPSSWVSTDPDISKSHLEYYYRMLAIITLSSTFLFPIVAIPYELQKKKDKEKSGKNG